MSKRNETRLRFITQSIGCILAVVDNVNSIEHEEMIASPFTKLYNIFII